MTCAMHEDQWIFWDWNGTLHDDAALACETLKSLFSDFNLPALSLEEYRARFGFPAEQFYLDIGITFEEVSFEELSNRFITRYSVRRKEMPLRQGIIEGLEAAKRAGFRQAVLSAYRQDMLDHMLEHYGITSYFEYVQGNSDLLASGKVGLGRKLLKDSRADPSKTSLFGDTDHDGEVAAELGCSCVLFTDGHQTRPRLEATGFPVVDTVAEALAIVGAGTPQA